MKKKTLKESIPNLDNLFKKTCEFVKGHQGEKGYIETQNDDCDTIFTLVYFESEFQAKEMRVHGVRVNPTNDDLEIVYDNDVTGSLRIEYSEEDFKSKDAEWESVRWSDVVYYVLTIFNIAEFIEEYVEA